MNEFFIGPFKNLSHAALMRIGQLLLFIAAGFGAFALIMIALPLHALSWTLTLGSATITVVTMFFAVVFLLFVPSYKNKL